jgi:TonB family protein
VFESFHSARRRTGQRAVPWILGGVGVHAALVLAAWISSLWDVERLEMPRGRIRLAGAIGAAPPPPPPPATAAPADAPIVPKKKRVTERVQPVPPAQVQPEPPAVEPPAVEPPAVEPAPADAELMGPGTGTFGDGRPSELIVRDSKASGPVPLGRYDKLEIDAPDEASRGLSGSIVLVLEIDVHGKVLRVELSEGMDTALDMQAMQLALKFRFRPARDDDGTPIPSRVSWTFRVHAQPKTS